MYYSELVRSSLCDGEFQQQEHPFQMGCPSRDRTVAVFDWDDTLCPSTWLHSQGLLPAYRGHNVALSALVRQVLAALEVRICALLTKALTYGPVFVVTAAETGWVEIACSLYLPAVNNLLKMSDEIHIVSARSWFERTFGSGGDALRWKLETLGMIASKCFGNRPGWGNHSLISVGDSLAERDACHAAVHVIPETALLAKTLKFIEHPDIGDILKQVDLAFMSFDNMCAYDNHLDLRISLDHLHATTY
ncbi:hypothetical protein AaE_006938 [Aphanomyces astaci]|uniref:Protein kinase n=1 Tax=Aphanomyces astaci TaxID=112090 RepID=A0A6A5AFT8_APHAT|nr:hypothetical protein AaE_006938 [Aphanomyces astaci]